jgi:small subunit ribosomal protein S1
MNDPHAPQDPTPAAEPAAPAPPATPAPQAAEPARVAEESPAHAAATGGDDAAATGGDEHEGEGGDDEHDAAGDAAEGGDAAAAGPGGAPAAAGEKKRRRRRRKKKPGAHAGEAGQPGAEGVAGSGEPGAEGASADASAEGAPTGEARPPKKDKKEKKHGPPRERPPVNVGDIVFGKIIEITPEAILIDIPGKAKAIFDRLELLLPEEEDERGKPVKEKRRVEEGPAPEGDASATADEGATTEMTVVAPSDEAPAAEAAAPVAEAPAAEAPAATPPADDAVVAEPAPEAPAADASTGDEPAPEPEPVKAPTVPRVVLEVGADFIGVVHNDGARGGLVVLTHHPRRFDKTRPAVEKAFADKTPVTGLVTGVIKGGLEVDVDGMRAFAPGSHVELRLGADLHHLVGQRLPFLVTQYAKRGRDLVLSRRSMLEEEAKKLRSEALSKLKVGEEIEGIVRSVVPFGAFVDIGGIEGLVPLTEMSHNRADGPSDVFKAGEPTRVKVTKIDDKGKIWLSHRATIPDPWGEVAKKYAQGTKHTGKVVRIQPFGVFIELEPGIDGLCHTADLSLNRIESPSEVVKVGDSIEVVVSHVEPGNHRIALHPALQGDAANEAPQRIVVHKPVKAKVVTIETGGLVVRILGVTGRSARGYVTAAGTGTPRGTELRKVFKVGQDIEGKVIELDPRRGEAKLSIKALGEDQERSAYNQYRQQVKAEAKFTFGDLLNKTKR